MDASKSANAKSANKEHKKSIKFSPGGPVKRPPKGNGIVAAQTLCPLLIVMFAVKMGRNISPFMYSLKEEWHTHLDIHAMKSGIRSWHPRRRVNGDEPNQIMMCAPNGEWPWWSWVCFQFANLTIEGMATKVATWMSDHSGIGSKFGPTKFVFWKETTTNPPSPVNHYFRDNDCVTLLKAVYSDPSLTKADIESDEDIMTAFFGTLENGQQVMSHLTEEDWMVKNTED